METPPATVMKTPDKGSTANRASLNGNRWRAVPDHASPAKAPTPAPRPPRPARQVSAADIRARIRGEESSGTGREAAAATATSARPVLTRLIDRSTAAAP